MGIGSFGTSFTTSFVTSRVSTRVLPPPINIGNPNPLLFCIEGFAEPDDRDDDFLDVLLLDEEPEPPFIFPKSRNKTATITTEASVTNTMIAVRRIARGMLYNS